MLGDCYGKDEVVGKRRGISRPSVRQSKLSAFPRTSAGRARQDDWTRMRSTLARRRRDAITHPGDLGSNESPVYSSVDYESRKKPFDEPTIIIHAGCPGRAGGGEVMLAPAGAAVSASAGVDDVQVLTRGPVHEAFAETVNFQPQPGMIVRATPPAAVEELPPEQKPDGANVIWISGYWAWDDEQNQFIWVSGIWRNVPPGRQWVPGYWRQPGDGQSQWISGYWADTSTAEVTYIPTAPPASLESGPNTESPSEDHSWIPGNWVWLDNRYAWRPGGWLPQREDWTWVPARYCWSPGGYIYVDGYWDYAVDCRGVLFAPVCFPRPVYDDPGYYYTPSIVIAADIFANHLFVRPYWVTIISATTMGPVIAERATMPVSRGIPAIAGMIRSTRMTGGGTAMRRGGKPPPRRLRILP